MQMIRTGWTRIHIAVLAIAMVALAACGSDGGNTGASPAPHETGTAPEEAAGEELVLPMMTPETGAGASFATLWKNGANLAIEEINADGGIGGRQVSLQVEDDGSDPARGATVARRIGPESTLVLVNTLSTVALSAVPVLNEQGTVALLPGTSRVTIIRDNRPWSFSTFPDLEDTFPGSIEVWKSQENIESVAIMVDTADAGSELQREWVGSALEEAGIEIADEVGIVTTDVDFAAVASSLRNSGADGFITVALPEQTAGVIGELRSQGAEESVWVSRVGWNPDVFFDLLEAEELEGVYSSEIFSPNDDRPRVREFVTAYEDAYGSVPDGVAALSYEAIYLLRDAFEELDISLDPADKEEEAQALRTYLSELEWEGPLGRVVMDPDGIARRDAITLTISGDGEVTVVSE